MRTGFTRSKLQASQRRFRYKGRFIDFAMAPDAKTPEAQVPQAYDIGDEPRHCLMAIRDEL